MSRKILYPTLISVVAIAGYFYYNPDRGEDPVNNEEDIQVTSELYPAGASSVTSTEKKMQSSLFPKNSSATDVPKKEIRELSPKEAHFFAESQKMMAQCLDFSSTPDVEQPNSGQENLLQNISVEMGEPIVASEDWMNTEIKLPSGERRRIHLEQDLKSTNETNRKLSYYSIATNGFPTVIPLPEDQANNPSESLLSSLLSEGETVSEERNKKIVFPSGDQLVLLEKDGHIQEYEMQRGIKTFRCVRMDSEGSCSCN